jgi:hypothetical protein
MVKFTAIGEIHRSRVISPVSRGRFPRSPIPDSPPSDPFKPAFPVPDRRCMRVGTAWHD